MAVKQIREGVRVERRKAARKRAILPALVLMGRREKKTKTANVSLGGLKIQTDEPLPQNRYVRVGFIVQSCPIEAEGKVVYSRKSGSGYVSGLSFEKISQGDKENLAKYLEMVEPTGSEELPSPQPEVYETKPEGFTTTTEVILPGSQVSALLILKGDSKSEKTVYEINRGVTSIGRHEENNIVLSDLSVSGHHAKIRYEDDGYFIYDFASTNGTRVNGRKVYRKRIQDGDIIQIGQPAFTFLTKKKIF